MDSPALFDLIRPAVIVAGIWIGFQVAFNWGTRD